MDGQAMDPKELVMQLVQTFGPELIQAVLMDEKIFGMLQQFVQAVGQMQPEQKQQLAQIIQQIAQQGAGNQEQMSQEPLPEEQSGRNPFAG